MTEPISVIYDFTANAGQLPVIEGAATTILGIVEANSTGVVNYQFYANPVTGQCLFSETYLSSEAFLNHAGLPAVGEALGIIMNNSTTNSLVALGNVSPEVQVVLGDMGATFIPWHSGFNEATLTAATV